MKSVYSKYLCEGSEYETYKEFRDIETAGYGVSLDLDED